MTDQEKMLAQKKRGRPATGKGLTVGVRLQPDILAAVDAAAAAEPDTPTRPEMIRRILTSALETKGYLK